MKLHTLKPAEGAVHSERRIARGEGSGKGGTATKGHKGAQSRSGYSKKLGFEGGQMPLQRRVPKFGFRNPNRVEYKPLNLSDLQTVADKAGVTTIDLEVLAANGVVKKNDKVKVLGGGELKAALEVKVHAFSASAIAAIEKVKGKAVTI